jgi:uncharacterized protein (TIGR03437 family)
MSPRSFAPSKVKRFALLVCAPVLLCAQSLKPPSQEFVLHFSTNNVAIANPITLGASFTMEGWIYLEAATRGPLIMGRASDPRTDPFHLYTLGLELTRPQPRFTQSTGQTGSARVLVGASDLPLLRWTHVASTLDAGTLRLYVNGVQVASGLSQGPPPNSPGPFSLGGVVGKIGELGCGCSFNGAMREVRLWSRALSPTELRTFATQKLSGNEPGLMVNWPLSDGKGATASAIGPQAVPMSIQDATQWSRLTVIEGGPYWELQDLPKFSSIPDNWAGITALFENARGHTDILQVLTPVSPPGADGSVMILHNQGKRVFTAVEPTPSITTMALPGTVTADFDGDGFEDVVLAGSGPDALPFTGALTRIFMQRSGELKEETAARLPPDVAYTNDICSADVDRNGSPDLLFADLISVGPTSGPKLYLNDRSGHFSAANNRMPPTLQPQKSKSFLVCRFIDANRDGAPDLLLGYYEEDRQNYRDWLLMNDGSGNFIDSTKRSMPLKRGETDWQTEDFAVADFNRDGWLDVAVLTFKPGNTASLIQLLINNQDGTFRDQPDAALNAIRTGMDERSFAPDLNQDGWPDLVVDETGATSTVRLYQNMGGTFLNQTSTLPPVGYVGNARVADFDRDGRLDILLATNNSSRMAWGKNLWPPVATGTPVISSVGMAGGAAYLAPNGWIEIKGTDLTPLTVPASGTKWDDARDFSFGELPSALGGVSVTIDGKTAYVYFVSPTQLNVLTPVDSTAGRVQIVVTSGGRSSAPFSADLRAAAPSFPLFGTNYIVSTHADNTLVGPASLSVPDYPVSPAKPGETIVLYGFGFGLPTTALNDGASTQSGRLPSLPSIQVGGIAATVTFAGVISPGLYQINVIVPDRLADGDAALSASYGGASAPVGGLIAVKR